MRKLPTDSRLGIDLRTRRKVSGLSQGVLATAAGLAEKTLRQLEQGRGNLDSWRAALEQLGLELVGRNLPPGDALGPKLATLRRRRRLNQRELAELVGVSQLTVVTLEGQGSGRIDTLERVLETLGAVPVNRAGRCEWRRNCDGIDPITVPILVGPGQRR